MSNILPTALFPNAELKLASEAVTADSFVIPFSDLQGLTNSEADPATGDGRELARVLIDTIASKYLALSTADRPARMIVTKANPQGIAQDTIRQNYTLGFDVSLDSAGVAMVSEL